MTKHLFVERPGAEPLDLDRTYTLTAFAKAVSERYGLGFHMLRKVLTEYVYSAPRLPNGVIVDDAGKVKRVYFGPAFTRRFINRVVPKLTSGLPIKLALTL